MRNKRLNLILDLLKRNQKMFIKDIETHFDISPITLRQDMQFLEKQGFISRSYGMAVYQEDPSLLGLSLNDFRPISKKRRQFIEEKRKMAAVAVARLIKPGAIVYIDDSTSAFHLLPFIKEIENITVLTNSLPVLYKLQDFAALRVYAIGGKFSIAHQAYMGKRFIDQIAAYDIDLCFLGTCSINFSYGAMESSRAVAEIKQAVAQRSEWVVILADHSKIGLNKGYPCIPWSQINFLCTDTPPTSLYQDVFQSNKIDCIFPIEN